MAQVLEFLEHGAFCENLRLVDAVERMAGLAISGFSTH
jgi:hypothetical protein